MTKIVNGSLPFTPSVEYSKYVEYSNIKECRKEKPLPTFIENKLMKQTLYGYSVNPLYRYISTIFWQIDINGNVRTGKIMKYDGKTGHRIKELHSLVTWLHSELKLPDFTLRQCFFGEHLLTDKTTTKTVAIDEQKTKGLDIADFQLMAETPQMAQQRLIKQHPPLQHLIDSLGLVLVEES